VSASAALVDELQRVGNDTASRDSVADSMAIRLHYGEGRIDLGWSSPLRLAPRLISARRSCHPKQ
jgi:hypothetical protein